MTEHLFNPARKGCQPPKPYMVVSTEPINGVVIVYDRESFLSVIRDHKHFEALNYPEIYDQKQDNPEQFSNYPLVIGIRQGSWEPVSHPATLEGGLGSQVYNRLLKLLPIHK